MYLNQDVEGEIPDKDTKKQKQLFWQQHEDFPTHVPLPAMFFFCFSEKNQQTFRARSQVDGVCELLGMAWKVLKMTELITWLPQLLESLYLGCLGCW